MFGRLCPLRTCYRSFAPAHFRPPEAHAVASPTCFRQTPNPHDTESSLRVTALFFGSNCASQTTLRGQSALRLTSVRGKPDRIVNTQEARADMAGTTKGAGIPIDVPVRSSSPGPLYTGDFARQQIQKQQKNNFHSSSLKMVTNPQTVNKTALHPAGLQYVSCQPCRGNHEC